MSAPVWVAAYLPAYGNAWIKCVAIDAETAKAACAEGMMYPEQFPWELGKDGNWYTGDDWSVTQWPVTG